MTSIQSGGPSAAGSQKIDPEQLKQLIAKLLEKAEQGGESPMKGCACDGGGGKSCSSGGPGGVNCNC